MRPRPQRLGDSDELHARQDFADPVFSRLACQGNNDICLFEQSPDLLILKTILQLPGRACNREQFPVANIKTIGCKPVSQATQALLAPQTIALFCTGTATENHNLVVASQFLLEFLVPELSYRDGWHVIPQFCRTNKLTGFLEHKWEAYQPS